MIRSEYLTWLELNAAIVTGLVINIECLERIAEIDWISDRHRKAQGILS